MAAFIPEPSNPEVLRRAAFYDFNSSTLVDIGHLPRGNRSEALAINESGIVCGFSTGIGQPMSAFIWQNGQMSALDLPFGPDAVAYSIADNGAICGWMGTAPHIDAHAFVWRDGETTDLGVILKGALGPTPRAICSNGLSVCGDCIFTYPDPEILYQRRAFIWRDGVAEDLGILPGYHNSIAYGVNDSQTVVGGCTTVFGGGPAFVWRNGVMKVLNDLIPPGHQLNIDLVKSINNAGQIAGSARKTDGSNDQVAVRLTPIPSPPGDCDCNGVVNIDDLLAVINQWGPAIPTTTADFDNNGTVGLEDLMEVVRLWTR
jgi:probable HAF family extracellular repeat protein